MTDIEELDIGRRKARRRMAWISFAFLIFVGVTVMFGLTGSPQFAESLNTAASPFIAIVTVFTTIILGYLGFSAMEQISKGR